MARSDVYFDINSKSCSMKGNSNTIELTVHTSCYCVLDLFCAIKSSFENIFTLWSGWDVSSVIFVLQRQEQKTCFPF